MVSINTIAILFLFGAIAIGGALAFSRIQSFFSNFQLPSLPSIRGADITDPRPLTELGLVDPIIGPTGESRIDVVPDTTGGIADRLRGVIDSGLTTEEQFDFSGLVGGVSPEPTGEPAPPFRDAEIFARDFPEPFVPISPTPEPRAIAPSILPDPISPITGFGGPSFEGGTIFENPVDTLSEVLNLFPNFSASMAADFLASFSGISPTEALAQGGDVINIIGSPLDPTQISNNAGEFSGLTSEEIFRRISGGVISNF